MRYIKNVVSVVSIILFFLRNQPTNLTEGHKGKDRHDGLLRPVRAVRMSYLVRGDSISTCCR